MKKIFALLITAMGLCSCGEAVAQGSKYETDVFTTKNGKQKHQTMLQKFCFS